MIGPVLSDRENEHAALCAAYTAARRGVGSLVVLGGPLGNGKSALLRAACDSAKASGGLVLRAYAVPLETDYAFGVARQLFEPLLLRTPEQLRERWLSGVAGPLAPLFSDDPVAAVAEAEACTPEQDRAAQLFAQLGMQALTERVSAEQPLLLAIDDVQWADEQSLSWLARLVGRLSELPVLVIATVREGDPATTAQLLREITGSAVVLRPRPLSLDGVRELVTDGGRIAADDAFVDACRTATGGNPLLLTEFLRELAAEGIAPTAESAPALATLRPGRLRDRLTDCVHALPEPVVALARALSVLGGLADDRLAGQLAELDQVACEEGLDALTRLGLLVRRDQCSEYVHDVVCDAVLEGMTHKEFEALHANSVQLLRDGGYDVERIARHLLEICTPQGPWSAGLLREAATAALRRGAVQTAATYLRRAVLDAADDGEGRARLLLELAEVEKRFDTAAAIRHVTHALPLIADVRERATAATLLNPGMLAKAPGVVRGMLHSTAQELGRLEDLGGADRELRLRLEARLCYVGPGDFIQLTAMTRRLREFGDRPPTDSPAGRELLAPLLVASVLTMAQPSREIARMAELVLEREPAASSDVNVSISLLAGVLLATESGSLAEPWLETALEHARRRGALLDQVVIQSLRAQFAAHAGRTTQAAAMATEALRTAPAGWPDSSFVGQIGLCGVALHTGDPGLIDLIEMSAVGAGDESAAPAVAPVRVMLRALARAAECPKAAAKALEEILDAGRELERQGWRNPAYYPWRTLAADLCRRIGDGARGRELAEAECMRAAAWGAPTPHGRALRVLGELTPEPEGVELLRDAVAVLEGAANRGELALALLALGTRLRERRDPEAARLLRRCAELAAELGDAGLAERAGRPVGRGGLTKAEERVLRLAGPHTNREIADFLGVSVRAVEKHLTNGYRKLGVRSRSELAGRIGDWSGPADPPDRTAP